MTPSAPEPRSCAAAVPRRTRRPVRALLGALLASTLWGLLPALPGMAAEPRAAVDVNLATRADLESLQGVGVALAERMLDARRAGPFRDWNDLRARVKGIDRVRAAALSAQGLTVAGSPYVSAPQRSPAVAR